MTLNRTAAPIPASGLDDGHLTGTTAQKHHGKSGLRKPAVPVWHSFSVPLVDTPLSLLPCSLHILHHINRVPVPFQQVQPMGAPGGTLAREVTTGEMYPN